MTAAVTGGAVRCVEVSLTVNLNDIPRVRETLNAEWRHAWGIDDRHDEMTV